MSFLSLSDYCDFTVNINVFNQTVCITVCQPVSLVTVWIVLEGKISLHFHTIHAVNFQKSRPKNHNKQDQPDVTLRHFNNTPLNEPRSGGQLITDMQQNGWWSGQHTPLKFH